MPHPQTIQIFLPSGQPQGLRQAEITTRTVQLFDVPKASLGEFLELEQAHRTGLYFLFSQETQDEERMQCYIGESDDVGVRLGQHKAHKEFWDRALIALSSTDSWTKAHVRYLEARAIQVAKTAGRYTLTNGNVGHPNASISKPLAAECDEFFETVSVLADTLGFPVLRELQSKANTKTDDLLHLQKLSHSTSGQFSADGLTVFSGTELQADPSEQANGRTLHPTANTPRFEQQREAFLAAGIIGWQADKLVFLRDHAFKSPSGAAAFIRGRSSNGWTDWQDHRNRTLDSIERPQQEQ